MNKSAIRRKKLIKWIFAGIMSMEVPTFINYRVTQIKSCNFKRLWLLKYVSVSVKADFFQFSAVCLQFKKKNLPPQKPILVVTTFTLECIYLWRRRYSHLKLQVLIWVTLQFTIIQWRVKHNFFKQSLASYHHKKFSFLFTKEQWNTEKSVWQTQDKKTLKSIYISTTKHQFASK